MTIRVLPKEVIDLIAAGEVIDSMTAVVRELVENAIDADADRIGIYLFPEAWRLRVVDNGRGMSREDMELCGYPHSTSKIAGLDDLFRIGSLGFRGEALSSIALVSRLSISSRHGEEPGWRAVYDRSGKMESIETIALAIGTIVTVDDLFGNYPVRRLGLPPIDRQLKDIQELIQNIALCHPRVTWQVFVNGEDRLRIASSRQPRHILPQIVKSLHLTDLTTVTETVHPEGKESAIDITLGLPDRISRPKPDWIKIAVNGRMVRCLELEKAILQSFSRTLPKDRYPVCFLHLRTCPSLIDWNRHPAKAEIYLQSLPFWREGIRETIGRALQLNPDSIPETARNQRVGELLKVAEERTVYQIAGGRNLLDLKAVAQIHNTYIVTEHPEGIWLVEQHIAHERVLYEELQDNWRIVPLDSPVTLDRLSPRQLEQFQRLGIEVEVFGERTYSIRSIPALLADRDDREEALLEIGRGGDLQTAQVAVACRSAIRNGTPLTLEFMQGLLDRWQNTRNPRTCPHGRPIYLSLEESSLSRFFRRHWVIGKSHGI